MKKWIILASLKIAELVAAAGLYVALAQLGAAVDGHYECYAFSLRPIHALIGLLAVGFGSSILLLTGFGIYVLVEFVKLNLQWTDKLLKKWEKK